MAARKIPNHGFGGDNREIESVLVADERVRSAVAKVEARASRLQEALHGDSRHHVFDAKRDLQDAAEHLKGMLASAELTDKTSGYRIRNLPKHGKFEAAHRILAQLERTIAHGERVRKHAARAARGDAAEMGEALGRERDRRPRPSSAAVSAKVRILRREGYPPKQAVAVAYKMLGEPRSRSGRRRRTRR